MQTALRFTARVQPGHRLEITAPELAEGEEVVVIVQSSSPFAPTTPSDQQALAERLLAQGAVASLPAGRTRSDFTPVPVQGRPVSETLIEERG